MKKMCSVGLPSDKIWELNFEVRIDPNLNSFALNSLFSFRRQEILLKNLRISLLICSAWICAKNSRTLNKMTLVGVKALR